MNSDSDHYRHERKLLLDGYALPEVLALIHRHPAGFREAYPTRWVNNLYLDSPGLDDYHDHVTGLPERSKSRIRWYGNLQGSIPKPVFERKHKQGALSLKRTHAVPPFFVNGGLGEQELREVVWSLGLENPLRRCVDHRQPSLINRYHRHYFVSAEGSVRLTVDSELAFYAPEYTRASIVNILRSARTVVVEIKYAPEEAFFAADIASWFPCRVARCSKYVLGIETIRRG